MNLYGPRQLVENMRTVRKNTIQIAEDIPEQDYAYRATPATRSVSETLVHIAWLAKATRLIHEERRLSSLENFDFGTLISKSEAEEKRARSKSEILDLLRTEGESFFQWIESLPEAFLAEPVRMPNGTSKNRFELLLGTMEHEMTHRSQLTVLERLLGIVPHLTRNRQQAREAAKAS